MTRLTMLLNTRSEASSTLCVVGTGWVPGCAHGMFAGQARSAAVSRRRRRGERAANSKREPPVGEDFGVDGANQNHHSSAPGGWQESGIAGVDGAPARPFCTL